MTSIGENAFESCKSLTSVTIPGSVTSIGNGAFWYCSNLESINVSENNMIYFSQDGILYSKVKMKIIYVPDGIKESVVIPDSITFIGNNTFNGCKSLTSVIIPGSVTSIGNDAFSGCTSLTSVTIPDSVTFIGSEAFYGCSNLKSMTFTDLDCTWYSYKVNSNYVIIANIEQLSTPMNLKNPVANVDYFKYFKKHLWFKRK